MLTPNFYIDMESQCISYCTTRYFFFHGHNYDCMLQSLKVPNMSGHLSNCQCAHSHFNMTHGQSLQLKKPLYFYHLWPSCTVITRFKYILVYLLTCQQLLAEVSDMSTRNILPMTPLMNMYQANQLHAAYFARGINSKRMIDQRLWESPQEIFICNQTTSGKIANNFAIR